MRTLGAINSSQNRFAARKKKNGCKSCKPDSVSDRGWTLYNDDKRNLPLISYSAVTLHPATLLRPRYSKTEVAGNSALKNHTFVICQLIAILWANLCICIVNCSIDKLQTGQQDISKWLLIIC